jgi:hypothetical protein
MNKIWSAYVLLHLKTTLLRQSIQINQAAEGYHFTLLDGKLNIKLSVTGSSEHKPERNGHEFSL